VRSVPTVDAIELLWRVRGGSQAHLIHASDGFWYVVKFQNNPQHHRILVNELLASELLEYLGVAAPQHAIVHFSPAFMAANPEACIQTRHGKIAVQPGPHFGSRYPGDPRVVNVCDSLTDRALGSVANLKQFLGALVFDRWVCNADARQAIFFNADISGGTGPNRRLTAQMIDHGLALNGEHWTLIDASLLGVYPRHAVYAQARSLRDFEPWMSAVVSCPTAVYDHARRLLPAEWIRTDEPGELDRLLTLLHLRQKRIEDLVADSFSCLAVHGWPKLSQPAPRWANSILACSATVHH